MDKEFNNLDEWLKRLGDMHRRLTDGMMMELAAIWVKGRRITEGDYVAIGPQDEVAKAEHASHKVVGCYGTVNSSRLEMMVVDVITNEPQVIVIK